MSVCMCICIYIYIQREREIETYKNRTHTSRKISRAVLLEVSMGFGGGASATPASLGDSLSR